MLILAVRLQFEFVACMSEVLKLERGWVDLAHRRVVWPDSKTGGMSKPMSHEAYRLLSQAPRQEGCCYVLPSLKYPAKRYSDREYYNGWRDILKAADLWVHEEFRERLWHSSNPPIGRAAEQKPNPKMRRCGSPS